MKIKHLKGLLDQSVKNNTKVNDLFGGKIIGDDAKIMAVDNILDN